MSSVSNSDLSLFWSIVGFKISKSDFGSSLSYLQLELFSLLLILLLDTFSNSALAISIDFVAGTFPEKRCKLNFGRSQGNFHEETKDDKYPYEETDTQDTNDVLSLHNSQSSIQLNEFEKAEIEP
jgi:hypothetical protein